VHRHRQRNLRRNITSVPRGLSLLHP
jgi:hypothetical protein